MVEVRNAEIELPRLRWRLVLAGVFVTVLFSALAARFVWL